MALKETNEKKGSVSPEANRVEIMIIISQQLIMDAQSESCRMTDTKNRIKLTRPCRPSNMLMKSEANSSVVYFDESLKSQLPVAASPTQ